MENNVQQPEWWYYCINGVHDGFSREMPPEDAYDKGTLTALYTAPTVPRDVLMSFGEQVRDAIHEYNGVDISHAVEIVAIADRYASQVQPEPVNQQLLTVARSILVPDMIDLLPPEYVAKVQSAIAAAEAAQPVYVQQWGRANRVKVTPTQQPASAQPLSDAELGDLIISIADSNGFDTKDPAGVDELCRAVARAIEARPASSHPEAVPDDLKAAALKEAEDELCVLGATLTEEGWDTGTIACTLDVIRIALYGGDGNGGGIEAFPAAVQSLHTLREKEAKMAEAQNQEDE